MADQKFVVGEPCFAKVKGYPAWPAEVTVIGGGKFEVFFFGTHEIARLTAKDLFKVNEANIDKFSHPKMKARKWYKEGLDEMMTLVQTRKTAMKAGGSSRTPSSGSKTLSITTPTKIPAIRSKDSQEDSSLSPYVMLDTRAVEKAIPGKNVATPRGKSKIPSPVKKSNINKASIKKPTDHVQISQVSPEPADPYRKVVNPTVTPSRRQLEDARKEATKSPNDKEGSEESSTKKRGSKRHPEQSLSPSKKQKPSEPIKMSININLEMSAETFLRVARELPGLLNLSSDQISTGMRLEN